MNHLSVRCATCTQVASVLASETHIVYYPPVTQNDDIARLYYRCPNCDAVEWLMVPGWKSRAQCEDLGSQRFDWSDHTCEDMTEPERIALLEHAITIWLRPELRERTLIAELELILNRTVTIAEAKR